MKIPETSANVGAYYGNEENGQWQPNGVIIDSGVGGGVVGSGDAGIHRAPVYPLHAPRAHVPAGYVMAGAFYPPAAFPAPAPPDDFEDYMWMENEEEFDKQVMQQLEEEALMEQCIEAMLEDEQREQRGRARNGHAHYPTTSNGNPLSLEETVSRSTLNPLAAEFVPTFVRRDPPAQAQPAQEEKQDSPQEAVPAAEAVSKTEVPTEAPAEPSPQEEKTDVAEVKTEVAESTTPSTPAEATEASADTDKRPKEVRKDAKKDAKKPPAKVEAKPKAKPQPAKSEPKVSAKKETRPARSEPRLDAADDSAAPELPKPQNQPPVEESLPGGPKPINYAAAARANKPKKPPTPTPAPAAPKVDKKPIDKTERKDRPKPEKTASKPEKVAPRKNSTK
ncbi:hypothetical protein ABMA27_012426 [Loxostege sticticalis]|uniref:Ataxin-2 C-terminal domain-containing protein n=1 Tax=Loxostege sticticalis TaxID=481309 RepID=A0ABR3H197_LOXSC